MAPFCKSDFEKEAQLADVQEQVKRHVEVMSKIGSMSSPDGSTLVYTDSITNIGLPRNHRFVGRVAVVALLNSELAPSFQDKDISLRAHCSCVIHATGGMGKTRLRWSTPIGIGIAIPTCSGFEHRLGRHSLNPSWKSWICLTLT